MRKLLLFLLVGLCAVPTLAQETRGTILGNVKDPSGALVPSVSITITQLETNTTTRTATGQSGLYEVPLLMPGQYEITAEAAGFKKYVRRGLTVSVGARLN